MVKPNSKRVVQRSARRGSAAVALVVAVALLALVTTAALMSGARDSRVGMDRMDGLHAMMAAEAGLRMGLRELSQSSDADSDGTVGAIGSSTPKAVGNATVQVAKATAGSVITLTSTGRRNNAVKVLQAQASLGGSVMKPAVYWSVKYSRTVKVATYESGTWTTGTTSPSLSIDPLWVVARSSPTRDETLVLSLDAYKDLKAVVRSGGSWGSWQTLCTDTAASNRRMVNVAYEQSSGDGLICYFKNTYNRFAYRTVTGGAISSETTVTLPDSDDIRWIQLVPKKESDEILIVTTNYYWDLRVATWNGSSLSSWTELDGDVETSVDECFSAAYQSVSGKPIVVWGRYLSSSPRYSIRTGSTWSSPASMTSVSYTPRWIRMASDPDSDAILFCTHNGNDEVWVNQWNGSSWGTPTRVSTDTGTSEGNTVDVAFEGTGTRGLVAYRSNGTSQVRYRTWNGSAWSSASTAFSPSNYLDYIELIPKPDTQEIYLAARSEQYLDVLLWDGTSMSAKTQLTNNLASTRAEQPYSLDVGTGSGSSGVSVSGISAP